MATTCLIILSTLTHERTFDLGKAVDRMRTTDVILTPADFFQSIYATEDAVGGEALPRTASDRAL